MGIGYSRNRTGQAPLANYRGKRYALGMIDLVLSLMMLAAAVLFGGAVVLFRRGEGKRGALMALLAVVICANVIIWVAPTTDGTTLAGSAAGE